MTLNKKIDCKSTKNEWKGSHNKIVWFKFVLMQDSWQQLESDSTSWQKTLKNSHNLQNQWLVVSALCQEVNNYLTRKVGFEGTPKLGSTTSFLQCEYGVEIRIESVNKDNSHSWVRISNGLNKLVTDLSNNKEDDNNQQETSEMQFEDCALKTIVLAFASRSKAKARPRRRTSACSSTRTTPISERSWTDIEPENYSSIAYPVSKQLITLLRHGQLPREEDGAIEFWRLNDYLRNDFENSQHWSDDMWKSKMAGGGGNKKKINVVLARLDKKLFTSELFKVIQDAIPLILHCRTMHLFRTISSSTFVTSDAHSIYIPSRIQDWYWEVKSWAKDRRYSFCLWILWTKNTKILDKAQYMHKAWKKHQNTVYWVDIKFAQKKGFKFYQTRSNAIILYDTLPA